MSTKLDAAVKELTQILLESGKNRTSPYDTQAEVVRVEGNIAWVHIPGGVDETPVKLTMNAQIGDTVQVRVSGGNAWLVGNATSPPTDDTTANKAVNMSMESLLAAQSAIADAGVARQAAETAQAIVTDLEESVESLDVKVDTAEGKITTIEGDITQLESDVSTAQGNITTIQGDITTLQGDVTTMQGDVTDIKDDISDLESDVSTAQGNITTIQGNITTLQQNVTDAQDDIDDAIEGLALAENVIGTLNWLIAHSTVTDDTTPAVGKSYYIKHQDGTFELVTDTTGKNPHEQGWYEMDSAISNYVGAHLALTAYGLNITLDNNSYRIHIGTFTANGDDGVYIIDENGEPVASYGIKATIGKQNKARLQIGDSTIQIVDAYTRELYNINAYGKEDSSTSQMTWTANGTDKEFDIPNVIVKIKSVTINNVAKVEGTDYTYGANYIRFNRAPSTGSVIKVTYSSYSSASQIHYTFGVRDDREQRGQFSVAEGRLCVASGEGSHAEGNLSKASGHYSHAEGKSKASAFYSHAEGHAAANGIASHAEGGYCNNVYVENTANGASAHSEGFDTNASGDVSHAEGYGTLASGKYSHAQNYHTQALYKSQTVIGEYNDNSSDNAFEIGNGADSAHRSNAFTVDWNGNVVSDGDITDGSGNVLGNKANTSELNSLSTRVTTAEGDIDTLDSNVSSLSTRVTTVESGIFALDVDASASASTDATSGEDMELFNNIRALGWYSDVII